MCECYLTKGTKERRGYLGIKGMPETPLMATSEGWRRSLKEVKSEKAAPVSIRNETLCPATVPITRSSESVCMGWTWGLELGLRHLE